jgi:hypothetical protein
LTETSVEGQINPQHRVGFEEAGVPQWTSIHDLKAERSD